MSHFGAASNREIDLYPSDLEFAVFSSEEVRKLSVVKVITGLTFDSLGRALPGGLYDAVMGSYGRSFDPCHTCFLFASCPGHMGHLELCTLVYNPFFKRLIYDILKLACLDCYRLQFQDHFQQILCTQLDLVDAGLTTEAQELEMYKSETVFNAGMNKNDPVHPKIREMRELLKGVTKTVHKTKNCYAVQTAITNTALQKAQVKKCIYCQNPLKKVRFSYQRLVIHVSKSEREALKEQNIIQEDTSTKVILADECRHYLREIYSTSAETLKRLFPILKNHARGDKCPMDFFFMDTILVTPPKSRPTNVVGDKIMEHPQTITYRKIIESNSVVRLVLHNMKNNGEAVSEESKGLYESTSGNTPYEKLYYAWQELQSNVDNLLDISQSRDKLKTQGLKQVLEKKEGLIRKHMMGKRVNYAARTVITPDPYINVDEVGVPELFAKRLSYPVPVTSWNVSALRKMIMNGPDVYPGANYLQDENGFRTFIPADDPNKRECMAKLLLSKPENGVKIVHRHVLNGDIMLMNRQPTLHKPSIMAHKARILRGEKTFRLHYSNCKAYNADFDGDEMNAHLPQSEVARSEAYNIASVPNQYLVPKDGTPLGGLIQDHVIAGVKLSIRGRFFDKEEYHQLVYQGLAHLQKYIKVLPPAILKPLCLWSGKQVLSTIICNIIPEGCPAINLTSNAKLSAKVWQIKEPYNTVYGGTPLKSNEMCESAIIVRNGELLCGVLDKQQYGATPYSLVHCMYELYGGECSTRLLTSFTRLFTYFLQKEGFTLGVRDILILREADEERRQIMKECREAGHAIAAEAVRVDASISPEELTEKLRLAHKENPKFRVVLDRQYKTILDGYTNNINKACLPNGLVSKFPDNNLQLMVLSGAKGSLVNTMQISCLLGQIELEGKRPPIMISGKSLPSFAPYDTSPRAGGFIDGRFLTGIQPQEFFFHCMAGREGLIDTAVKTSRSGYLQRCLIKHLEGLNIAYDLTVRDSDNSVIQFLYGEDGLDIGKSQFLNMKNMKFLEENIDVINHATGQDQKEVDPHLHKYHKKLKSWRKKNRDLQKNKGVTGFQQFSAELRHEVEVDNPQKLNKKTGRLRIDEKIIALWNKADAEKKESYSKKYTKRPDPLNSKFKPDMFYGAVSEYFENLIENYVPNDPLRKTEIKNVLYTKGIRALAQPGEPVGLLAAQSIGEPSTQMTLNTFHFAGRGEMNVTLGIPRLREILMLASANIKTPSMDIPFKPGQEKHGEKLRTKLNRVTVAEVLEYINVKHKLALRPERKYQYTLHFKLLPKDAYEEDVCIKPKQILKYISGMFVKLLFRTISRSNKNKRVLVDIGDKEKKDTGEPNEDDVEQNGKQDNATKARSADDSSDDDVGDDDDAAGIKLKARKRDENDYDDPEEEEELKDANDDDDIDLLNDQDDDKEGQLHENDDSEILKSAMNHQMVNGYDYDRINYLWCKLQFDLPMSYKNLDMSSILQEVAQRAVIYEVPHIKRAITYMNNNDLTLKTDGINIVEMFKYNKILDLNRLYTNDIHAISQTYGIEAAARVVVKEVQNVFKVYGIVVNPRHLLLIADYMTFDGTFKPLSRKGLEFSASPLQQMSFESCLQFLKSATITGKEDELSSPSSRLMVGLPINSGTGSFSLLAKVG